jgi:hypothetical protein
MFFGLLILIVVLVPGLVFWRCYKCRCPAGCVPYRNSREGDQVRRYLATSRRPGTDASIIRRRRREHRRVSTLLLIKYHKINSVYPDI